MARVTLPINEHMQFYSEWRWYSLNQPYYLYEGFRTNQFVTAMRWTK